MTKTTKSKSTSATTIADTDAQYTAFQTKITTKILKLIDRIVLTILQHLIKLSGRKTSGLLIPLEWDEGYEELFQLLMEVIWSPLHPLVEEGLERLAKIFDVVVEALNGDGFDWGTGER